MDKENNDFVAFIKYEGADLNEGYMDARKAAEALIGIDEVTRYFLHQLEPSIKQIPFDIPVKISKGSWIAELQDFLSNVSLWDIAKVAGGTYLTTAVKKAAENDFKERGLIKEAFKAIKWVIKIASHLGSLKRKKFDNVSFKDSNTLVVIKNDQGNTLDVPEKYLRLYIKCPDELFSKIVSVVDDKRELSIGINPLLASNEEDKRPVVINIAQKYIFTKIEEEREDIILPELLHNQYVELQGHIHRGNEATNTLGFKYGGHTITCLPANGNIIDDKTFLFTNCIIKGIVERLDSNGKFKEKRPRIKYMEIIPIEENTKSDLFNT